METSSMTKLTYKSWDRLSKRELILGILFCDVCGRGYRSTDQSKPTSLRPVSVRMAYTFFRRPCIRRTQWWIENVQTVSRKISFRHIKTHFMTSFGMDWLKKHDPNVQELVVRWERSGPSKHSLSHELRNIWRRDWKDLCWPVWRHIFWQEEKVVRRNCDGLQNVGRGVRTHANLGKSRGESDQTLYNRKWRIKRMLFLS